ncbi:MAG: protein kinase [Myxococcota bacterium]
MSEGGTGTVGPCPDETVLAEMAQGGLSPEEVEEVESHLDQCEQCCQVVAELVRIFAEPSADGPGLPAGPLSEDDLDGLGTDEMAVTLGVDDESPRPLGPMLSSGAAVGRYRVLECVGVGGMGVVYAAYDPELDRRVALKLLRGSSSEAGSQGRGARLLREAQALAKLSHPNVITVHDVGTWEGQVFVAMEFIDGGSLKDWMEQDGRSWPEIREVFVAAGRGLAAAHAMGMVHRDFKPDNVLIGSDGRVRVTDFGLARWGESRRGAEDLVATDELASSGSWRASAELISQAKVPMVSLTETGTLVGTPAYMAPEQYEQRPADAATDQFAFCVALFEAIYGERPFAGDTLVELVSNVLDGRLAEGTRDVVVVPRRVRQALRRGLSRKRKDRFANMTELLMVLDRRPARWWRWGLAVGVPVVLGAGLLAQLQRDPPQAPRSAFCREESGLGSVWTPTRRQAAEDAFTATGLGYAPEAAERALAAVDDYVGRWEEARAYSCVPDESEQGPELAVLRARCLSRHRVALETLLETFDEPNEKTVARAVGAVAGLPEIENCSDADKLMAGLPPPVPPEQREAVERVRDELARGHGLIAAGRYAEGLELAKTLDAEAKEISHRPLEAETRFLLGQMLDRTATPEAADEAFAEAALLAVAARHRKIAAKSLMHRVYVAGALLARTEEAEALGRWAEAEIEGAGLGAKAMAPLLLNLGSVAYRRGDYDGAAKLFARSLELIDREKDPLRWADAAFNLASVQVVRGREAEGIVGLEEYIEVFEAAVGRTHPEVAVGYQNLGIAYMNFGRNNDAEKVLAKAESIRRETLGEDHPEYASTLNMLGSLAIEQGRVEEGMRYIRRAIDIQVAAELDTVAIGYKRTSLARALMQLGRLEESELEAERALEAFREKLGDEHPDLGPVFEIQAAIAAHRKNPKEVRRLMSEARRVQRGVRDADDPDADRILVDRASLLAEAGERAEGIGILRAYISGLSIQPRWQSEPHARMRLGEILWSEPAKRDEARELIRQAEIGFRALEMVGAAEIAHEFLAADARGEDPQAED